MMSPSRIAPPALALLALLAVPHFVGASSLTSPTASSSGATTPGAISAAEPQDTSALQFHGFRAGARLDELAARVRRGGGRLRCDRAVRDQRVSECRGTVTDSALGGPVHVWVSAIDSAAGVVALSAGVDAERLDRWRRTLEMRYGGVRAKAQGSQRMMQWVRRGRMLRLTWRIEGGERTASVSLVDGRVLDAWGAARATASP